jgi:hypothetical protein
MPEEALAAIEDAIRQRPGGIVRPSEFVAWRHVWEAG